MGTALGRRGFLGGMSALASGCAVPRGDRTADSGSPVAASDVAASERARGETEVRAAADAPANGRLSPERKPAPELALFEAFPALKERMPRRVLGELPTPLEPLNALASAVEHGAGSRWLVKRDDRSSALYGGGKVRKLELFLGEALAKGATTVVTCGAAGSNQAVAVARHGAALGLVVRLYLAPQIPGPHVKRNLVAMVAAGAELRRFATVTEAERQAKDDAARDPRVYVIPPGGTSPLGTLGFVSAGLELAKDASALEGEARVYAALGTGGSAVGLALGLHLAGARMRVVAVRASTPGTSSIGRLRRIHQETMTFARNLDRRIPEVLFEALPLEVEGRFLGAGYGSTTADGERAAELLQRTEGMALEPVYTAKTMAALLLARTPESTSIFLASQSAVPLPEGPMPALFADLEGDARSGGRAG